MIISYTATIIQLNINLDLLIMANNIIHTQPQICCFLVILSTYAPYNQVIIRITSTPLSKVVTQHCDFAYKMSWQNLS